jgi:hypothetical protein
VISLSNDDLGDEDMDNNVIILNRYRDVKTGDTILVPLVLVLPADAYRDKSYIEWLISSKEADSSTDNDF